MMVAMLGVFIVVILLVCGVIAGLIFLISGLILRHKAKKKDSKVRKRIGTALIVTGILVTGFNLTLAVLGRTALEIRDVKTPGGSTHVFADTADRALDLAGDNTPESNAELRKIVDKEPGVLYYKVLGRSVVSNALECGNYEAVAMADEHGFDWNDEEFFADGSPVFFLRKACEREIKEDDVRIMDLLLAKAAGTAQVSKTEGYSNIFGMAAWTVLYNREYDYKISDAELGLIRSVASHAELSDPGFRFAGEEPYPDVKDALYTIDALGPVEEDSNYKELLRMLGREDADQEMIFRSVYKGEE